MYPVVLGHGRRLFTDATEVPRLRLVETKSFRSGIVLLRSGSLTAAVSRIRIAVTALGD
ncbi:MAG: hypothetical protein H0X61_08995 [Acidimicrobiia bacterium]|jgi:hypothetical protein|nr:hypothetical protein [Acidimicrobiia bacterium]